MNEGVRDSLPDRTCAKLHYTVKEKLGKDIVTEISLILKPIILLT